MPFEKSGHQGYDAHHCGAEKKNYLELLRNVNQRAKPGNSEQNRTGDTVRKT
jgi:hypothetical protein